MAVFPENMNRLPPDTNKAVLIMDQYIRYMRDRIEVVLSNIQLTIRNIPVAISGLQSSVQTIGQALTELEARVSALEGDQGQNESE